MVVIDVDLAKEQLADLVNRAIAGEAIVIGRDGRPVARLVPILPVVNRRTFGRMRGKVRIADDFDAPLPGFQPAGSYGREDP